MKKGSARVNPESLSLGRQFQNVKEWREEQGTVVTSPKAVMRKPKEEERQLGPRQFCVMFFLVCGVYCTMSRARETVAGFKYRSLEQIQYI